MTENAANHGAPPPLSAHAVRVSVEVSFVLDRTQAAGSGPFDEATLAAVLLEQVRDELVAHFNQGAVMAPQVRVVERRRRRP